MQTEFVYFLINKQHSTFLRQLCRAAIPFSVREGEKNYLALRILKVEASAARAR